MLVPFTTEEFISKSIAIHGDKYDYSMVDYKGNRYPVSIICPIHGVFVQLGGVHLRGNGCRKCFKDTQKQNDSIRKKSPYKGVHWCVYTNKWIGALMYNKKILKFYGDNAYDVYMERETVKHKLKPQNPIINLDGEEWRDIVIADSEYSISNKGRIKTYNYRNTGDIRILEPHFNRSGYKEITIGRKSYRVHRLVAMCFLDGHNETINHKDGNKCNNCAENLEWVSIRSNRYHLLIVVEKRKYVGIKWSKVYRKWVSHIEIDGRDIRLGVYQSPKDAHERFRKALLDYGLIEDYNYLVKIMAENGYE